MKKAPTLDLDFRNGDLTKKHGGKIGKSCIFFIGLNLPTISS